MDLFGCSTAARGRHSRRIGPRLVTRRLTSERQLTLSCIVDRSSAALPSPHPPSPDSIVIHAIPRQKQTIELSVRLRATRHEINCLLAPTRSTTDTSRGPDHGSSILFLRAGLRVGDRLHVVIQRNTGCCGGEASETIRR